MKKINFKELPITKEEIKSVVDTLKSGYLTLGPKVAEFEDKFAKFVGSKYAVATNSCTMGLQLAMKRNLPDGALIGLPSMNCAIVPAMVLNQGYGLYFYDDTEWIGNTYELFQTGIVDSAEHLVRNQYREHKGKTICFSFYPTKEIGGAEGGMIITDSKEDAEWLDRARNWGRKFKGEGNKSWEQEVEFAGWKGNMSDIQAAILLPQLERLDQTNEKRRRVRDWYNDRFQLHNKSLYLYRTNIIKRDQFIEYMKDNGVTCGIHFRPNHLMKAFNTYLRIKDLTETEQLAKTTVSLPLHHKMTKGDVDYIYKLVRLWERK